MRALLIGLICLASAGCTVERLSPPGLVLTRPVAVPTREVRVFAAKDAVPAPYSVVEEIWIKDDGTRSPSEMASELRMMAGARGANGLLMAKTNRGDNTTRIDLKVRFDNPFDYFSGKAIWVGPGGPRETYLGTIGRKRG